MAKSMIKKAYSVYFIDIVALVISIFLSFLVISYSRGIPFDKNYISAYVYLTAFESIILLIINKLSKQASRLLYRNNADEIISAFYSTTIIFILSILFLYITKFGDLVSRIFVFVQAILFFIFSTLFRFIYKNNNDEHKQFLECIKCTSIDNINFERVSSVKTEYPITTCRILGVNIADVNMNSLLDYVVKHIQQISGEYICAANVHTTVTSYEDKGYLKIQNNSLLTIPDGGPLSSLGKKRGHPGMERTTGPDFMEEIFKLSEKNQYRHYFYGSSQETLDKMKETLLNQYPNLEIVGMYSPPYRNLTEEEDRAVIKKMNDVNPDFIWVGLGAPKQEIWMAEHKGIVKGLMVGVGAAFDYKAGNINRAPMWMQENDLEWLYRLIQEPSRLIRRYLITNTKFILYAWILRK